MPCRRNRVILSGSRRTGSPLEPLPLARYEQSVHLASQARTGIRRKLDATRSGRQAFDDNSDDISLAQSEGHAPCSLAIKSRSVLREIWASASVPWQLCSVFARP
jgi:hypothetical protein